jgi:hypothetical protein
MKAEIKSYYSNDINMISIADLNNYIPEQVDCFCFLLTILIGPIGVFGPKGEDVEESLDFIVCTPKYLINEYENKKEEIEDVFFGKDYLIVFEYNFEKILNHIKKLINSVEDDTWDAIGQKLSRYGRWEFEDYKEE